MTLNVKAIPNSKGYARVLDVAGKLLIKLNLMGTDNKINVNHLPKGLYYLEVVNNKTSYRTSFEKH
jgi:hypothetical protein